MNSDYERNDFMSDEIRNNNENTETNIGNTEEAAEEVITEATEEAAEEVAEEATSEATEEATTEATEESTDLSEEDYIDLSEEDFTEVIPEETSDNSESSEENTTSSYEWAPEVPLARSEEKQKKSDKGFKVFVAVMLTVFTLSAVLLCAMVAVNVIPDILESGKTVTNESNKSTASNTDYGSASVNNPNYVAFDFEEHDGKALSVPEIAAKCTPSSVGIISEIETSYNYPFYFSPQTRVSEASGSGFIYSADGYVITNHHVIDGAKKITVILHDNTEFEATLVGSDELSDIAVLKITPDEKKALIPMEMGNSDELVVGEAVVAIGCPAGIDFIGTVTDGIVSAINRNVEITDEYGDVQKNMTLIQTNATINHGNSGGPLINTRGQVIGINTLKLASNYEGVGFSIPINGAKPIINQLIEHGKVIQRTEDDFAYGKGIIGINGSAISESEAEFYGIPRGVLVVQINRDGSASKAGLRRGDIITHYNGKEVMTVEDINNCKGSARAGTEVTLTVYRDGESGEGETLDITFTLDAQ